jgi:hypothetical protein
VITTSSSEARERAFIFGTWLIGIGSVFAIKEAMRWEWSQAWPLFVIMLGACGGATAIITRRHTSLGWWGIWWPLVVMVVGVVLLLAATGSIPYTLRELVAWWPLAAIAVGAWFLVGALFARGNTAAETLAIPLGGLTEAEVKLSFGGGELTVRPAEPGMFLAGRFDGGVIQHMLGPGRVELKPFDPGALFLSGRALHWDVGISADIPVDLRLDTGASRSKVDLSALRIRRLELHTGASETSIRLPAAGASTVRVEAGVASVTLEVPAGVAARIKGKVTMGSTDVDQARFPRALDGWASPDYESATNRVDIDLEGGLGSITVR